MKITCLGAKMEKLGLVIEPKTEIFIENFIKKFSYKLKKEFLEIDTYFQPIFCSKTFKVLGYEAFSKPRTNKSILQLIKESVDRGFISEFDLYCRLMAIYKAYKVGFPKDTLLFLNIHPKVLERKNYPKGLTFQFLSLLGLSSENIVFEITEFEQPMNIEGYIKTVFHFKEQGYKISIDDYGSGCISSRFLLEISPNFLKIDKFFVQRLPEDNFSIKFITQTLELCKDLEVKVIAEGIENKKQLLSLKNLKVDYLQGYYLGKPKPSFV
ncbi:MAG: EAL domain-containing protein [Thermodesulfobacterium sp.]|nr:EAL domain-containing protein [Thermodesulfobacterium sp.]